MKKITLLLLMFISGTVFGQVVETTTADAVIIEAITVTPVDNLDFGVIAPDPLNPTTVTIAASAGASRSSTDATLVNGSPAEAEGQFDVTGSSIYSYHVSFLTGTVLDDGGGNTMPISYTFSEGEGDYTGNKTFYIGGELTIPAGQTPGSYSDDIEITVQYN